MAGISTPGIGSGLDVAGISTPGIGSGLDVAGLVNQLVTAETQSTASKLFRQESAASVNISALGQLSGSLSNLQTSVQRLTDSSDFFKTSVNVSDKDALSVSASGEIASGEYAIKVNKLAERESLASAAFADKETNIGSGTLTIEFGSYNTDVPPVFTQNTETTTKNIIIDSSSQSVEAIKEQINSQNIGVTASIIQDGNGAAYLTFTADDTGANNALKITVADDDGFNEDGAGLSQLLYDPTTVAADNMTRTNQAIDSEIEINGLIINGSSNQLTDIIDGTTIDLKVADTEKTINVTVGKDQSVLKTRIEAMIKSFNEVLTTINAVSGYDPETKRAGALQGDASVRTLKSQLQAMISAPVEYLEGDYTSMASIGIETGADGKLSLDAGVFNKAAEADFDAIARIFSFGAYSSDELTEVKSVAKDLTPGQYTVNVTAMNLGTLLEGTIGGGSASSVNGRLLEASGSLSGLSVNFFGGGTGSRGTITVHNGVAAQLNEILESYIGTGGSIKARTESLNEVVKDVGVEREALAAKADRLEARYLKQFTSLDILLSQSQGTASYLTQQLGNLPGFTRD